MEEREERGRGKGGGAKGEAGWSEGEGNVSNTQGKQGPKGYHDLCYTI